MYVITNSEYNSILDKITTYPSCFPPLSLKKELDSRGAYYLNWAIWCVYGLPKPKNSVEEQSLAMIVEYIGKHLKIVADEDLNKGK